MTDDADERAAIAEKTINSQLQHTDAITVLAMALERNTLALDAHRLEMEQHGQRLREWEG